MFLHLNFSEKKPWRQFFLFLYITFIAYALFNLLLLLLMRGMHMEGDGHQLSYAQLLMLSVLSELFIFMMPALFWGYYYSPATLQHNLCLEKPRLSRSFFPFLLAMIAVPMAYALSELNQVLIWKVVSEEVRTLILEKEQQVADILSELFLPNMWYQRLLTLFALSIVPAFCEELFFRGVLQPILFRIMKSKGWAIFCTAFVFSFFHLQLLGFFPRLFLGIVLGVLFWETGALWLAILFHALFNLVSSLLLLVNGRGGLQDYLEAHSLSFTTLILGVLSLIIWVVGLWKGRILRMYFFKDRI